MNSYRLSLAFVLVMGVNFSPSARAKADPASVPDLTLAQAVQSNTSQPAWVIDTTNEPKRECRARFMAGPGMGVVLGTGALLAGSIFTAVGARGLTFDNMPAAIGIGSAALALGAGAIAFSGYRISKNRDRRSEVCGHPLRAAPLKQRREPIRLTLTRR